MDLPSRPPAASSSALYCQVGDLVALAPLGQQLGNRKTGLARASDAGHFQTRYKGRGLSFAEARPYQAGDDVRTIDWRVTARTQVTHTKVFEEERDRPVLLLVDMRSPLFFGSRVRFKCVQVARLAAVFGWSAHAAGCRLGALVLGDDAVDSLRPHSGPKAPLALIHSLAAANAKLTSPATPASLTLDALLDEALRVVKPGALVYLISDAHDSSLPQAKLQQLRRHADVQWLTVSDAFQAGAWRANADWLSLTHGDKRARLPSAQLQRELSEAAHQLHESRRKHCNQSGLALIDCPAHADLTPFFSQAQWTGRSGRAAPLSQTLGSLHRTGESL
jgi:uncharacterized protein (DUF58 family)